MIKNILPSSSLPVVRIKKLSALFFLVKKKIHCSHPQNQFINPFSGSQKCTNMVFFQWRGNWHLLVVKDGYTYLRLQVRLTIQFQSIWQILRGRNKKKQKASESISDSKFLCHACVTHWITLAHSLREIDSQVLMIV